MNIQKIYFDLDGVLVEFVPSVYRLFTDDPNSIPLPQKWDGIHQSLSQALDQDISENDLWCRVGQCDESWWANLPPLTGGINLIKSLVSLDIPIEICTSPAWFPSAPEGKKQWVRKHLGFLGPDLPVHLRSDKHLLANPQTLLIDDAVHQVERFRGAGGWALPFPQPWNRSIQTPFWVNEHALFGRVWKLGSWIQPELPEFLLENRHLVPLWDSPRSFDGKLPERTEESVALARLFVQHFHENDDAFQAFQWDGTDRSVASGEWVRKSLDALLDLLDLMKPQEEQP